MTSVDAAVRTAQHGAVRTAVGSLIVAVLVTAHVLAEPRSSLSPRDIADSIRLGQEGDPQPYLMRHVTSNPARKNTTIVGVVYTPFIRIALAAHAAREAGRPFTAADVRDEWLEPVAYIAFRWYVTDSVHNLDDVPANVAWVPNSSLRLGPGRAPGVKPRAVRRGAEAIALLSSFGATAPYADIALVAAFPAELLRTDGRFVVSKELPRKESSGGADVQVASFEQGQLLADELAGWR